MKIYVTTAFVNKIAARELMNVLEANYNTITSDWTTESTEGMTREEADSYEKDKAILSLRSVREADLLVFIEHGESKGAFIEIGYALARRVPFIVLKKAPQVRSPVFFHLAAGIFTGEREMLDYIEEFKKNNYVNEIISHSNFPKTESVKMLQP